jgi:hypothetical protein
MDLTKKSERKKLIDRLEGNANKGRKTVSYQASEIYSDNIKDYVIAHLREQFDEESIKEIPLVSSINLCKRVVDQRSCVYKEAPQRDFTEVSEEQVDILNRVYDDMGANTKLGLSNRLFSNHNQCLLQVLPKKGKLVMRVLKPHQWDAVVDPSDPEEAMAIIISSYDNYDEKSEAADEPNSATGSQTNYKSNNEVYKQDEASKQLLKEDDKTYLVWTKEENYFMNREGTILGEPLPNPLKAFDMLPFIEISGNKEFEYWVRSSNAYSSFTVEFNATMSHIQQIVKMQGYAQAVLSGPQELLMENIKVGPNYVLKLPVDKNAGIETKFEFASPGSDIRGSLDFLEVLLTAFLTSNGLDAKTVSLSGEGTTYNSGLERLLAMLEKVSASREDYDLYEKVEGKLFKLITAWLEVLNTSETLDRKYYLGAIPEDAQVKVEFAKPEMVTSEVETLDQFQREIDMGIASPISILMERDNLTREQAEERYLEYQDDQLLTREPERVEIVPPIKVPTNTKLMNLPQDEDDNIEPKPFGE